MPRGGSIYVGKAKNLRSRAGSYFQKTAADDRRICDWIGEVADIDFLAADSEVDALLLEARLIKDIQPKHNQDLKDDKSFPYLQITTGEDFPRVNFTREPLDRGVKLYGPFPRAKSLRGAIQVLQRIFKFRTCSLDIEEDDPRWRWFRPCLLHSIDQCTAPCNLRIDREEYRNDIRRLRLFLEGKKDVVLAEMEEEMREASKALQFEKAARLRDEIKALAEPQPPRRPRQARAARGLLHRPEQGPEGAARRCSASSRPRGRSRAWTSPTSAAPRRSARWSRSSTACRSSRAIAATRSRASTGVDDFASIREVVSRRIQGLQRARRAVPRHPPDRRRQGPAQRGPRRLRGPEGRLRRP